MTNEQRNVEMLRTGQDPVKLAKARKDAEFYASWKAEQSEAAVVPTVKENTARKAKRRPIPSPLTDCPPDTRDVLLPEQDYRLLGATSWADLYNGVTFRRAVKARNDDYPNN